MAIDKHRVVRLRAEAIRAWSDALGDSTACALTKSGRSFPAAKFHEGRVAAVGELLRSLRDDPSPNRISELAATLGESWERRPQPRTDAGGEWASYRAGGLEALRELGATDVGES
jgi:hypothetical protein